MAIDLAAVTKAARTEFTNRHPHRDPRIDFAAQVRASPEEVDRWVQGKPPTLPLLHEQWLALFLWLPRGMVSRDDQEEVLRAAPRTQQEAMLAILPKKD